MTRFGMHLCAFVSTLLVAAVPARADLTFDFVELEGVPFLRSIPIPVRIALPFEDVKRTIEFDGWAVGGRVSREVADRWHVYSSYQYRESSSSDVDIIDSLLNARGDLALHSLGAGAGFHPMIGESTMLFLEFGFLYNRVSIDAFVTYDIGAGPTTAPVSDTTNNFGFVGTAGVRHMQTERLELFGSMSAEAPDVTSRNFIYFDLGARYDFTDWLGAATTLQFGTDGHVGVLLGLRVYYDEWLSGKRDAS